MTCKPSFPGNINEIPGIGVDNFNDRTKSAYFLSHCHADHISGLRELPDSCKPVCIYMSEISAAIVETHLNKDLKRFIKPLLGKTTIKLSADEESGHEEMYVQVTPIPAGHCFGSVMFLFETTHKKILYTGDFRITENRLITMKFNKSIVEEDVKKSAMRSTPRFVIQRKIAVSAIIRDVEETDVSKLGQLHDVNNKPIKLDVLYVDTTFQDASHETFPKRSETIAYVVREIEKWLALGDECRVALEPSARYGYEFVFNKIFEFLKMKVYVKEQNWDLYSKFLNKLPGVTNDETSTKIHLCSERWRRNWYNTNEKMFCTVCPDDSEHKYLYISFCAKKWEKNPIECDKYNVNPEEQPLAIDSNNQITICFATHCSRSELVHFVEYLNPIKVVGFSEPYKAGRELAPITPVKRKTPYKTVDQTHENRKKVAKNTLRNIFG